MWLLPALSLVSSAAARVYYRLTVTGERLPVVGLAGLRIRERWRGAWSDASRFLLLRSRRRLIENLRVKQKDLAVRLKALYDAWEQTAHN